MTNENKKNSSVTTSWQRLYSEAALYKAAVRMYTKPFFFHHQRWQHSHDGQTFYDFARNGIKDLNKIHQQLRKKQFSFGHADARQYNFNGKIRTLYIYPWAERLVDLMLYRELCFKFDESFNQHSYAYRIHGFGVNQCQRDIQKDLRQRKSPVYVIKRDIKNYFDSIDHESCLAILQQHFKKDDYLYELLASRVKFTYYDNQNTLHHAEKGVPFGTAISCFLANLVLNEVDHKLNALPGLSAFRYADDFLILSSDKETANQAITLFEAEIASLNLEFKESHSQNMVLDGPDHDEFKSVSQFRHLGLTFSGQGHISLSREKFRKICNLFKYALQKQTKRHRRVTNPYKRAKLAVRICKRVINSGVHGVALIDYYLRHVEDEACWRRLDLWLAEECLHWVFGKGHKKGYFKKIPFSTLREMGLPSLQHRRMLIKHGHIESAFFVWKNQFRKPSLAERQQNNPLITSPETETAVTA